MTNALATPEVAVSALQTLVRQSEAKLEKFKKNLDTDPTYAFSWGDTAVLAAATLQVSQSALRALTEPGTKATVATLVEFFTKEVMYGARNPPSSTSKMSNFTRTCMNSANVLVLDILTNYL